MRAREIFLGFLMCGATAIKKNFPPTLAGLTNRPLLETPGPKKEKAKG